MCSFTKCPRICARRKGTHPVHANLTLKFIYTCARGMPLPPPPRKFTVQLLQEGRQTPSERAGRECETRPCGPAPGGRISASFLPLLSFFGTPLPPTHPLNLSLGEQTDYTYLPPADSAASRRRRQTAPAPLRHRVGVALVGGARRWEAGRGLG